MKTHLMSIDAGGGGAHCLIVDVASGAISRGFARWQHPAAPGTGGLGSDLDLAVVRGALAAATAAALRRAGIDGGRLAGLAVTSMRHTTIVLGEAGELLLATPNRDARAAGEAFRIAGEMGDEIYDRTGHWPGPMASAVRLRWLAETQPQTWRRARRILTLSDWIGFLLTGVAATEPSQAAESLLFDVRERAFLRDLPRRFGVAEDLLPPLQRAGTLLGPLGADGAALLGLVPGIPVAVAGADTQCGLVGAGALAPGSAAAISASSRSASSLAAFTL
jgi:autoinducer 2 (AI-2) kinase